MRVRKTLEGHDVVNWQETVQNHEIDASVADEVEAALDGELEAHDRNGGQGAVTVKRAAFQYGSAGSRPLTSSPYHMPDVAPGDTSLRPGIGGALQRHGPSAVRLAARSGSASESHAVSHARGVIQQLGNGRNKK